MTDNTECRKAFEGLLPKMGGADEFGCYNLDEGNLYWLFCAAYNTRNNDKLLREAHKVFRDLRYGIFQDVDAVNQLLDETITKLQAALGEK